MVRSHSSLFVSLVCAVGVFLFCQFAIYTREQIGLKDELGDLQLDVNSKHRQLSELQQTLRLKERELFRLKRRVEEFELKYKEIPNKPNWNISVPTIFVITPTDGSRFTQRADLTRLVQTLIHISSLHWIIVEDAAEINQKTALWLKRWPVKCTYLSVLTPSQFKMNDSSTRWKKPRGVEQRNKAIDWLRRNHYAEKNAIVYFADDDNTYDIRLFDEIRSVKKVGVWPVGLVGELMVERPVVDSISGKVYDFVTAFAPERVFPIDMAGFAVNIKLLLKYPKARFSYEVKRGYQESHLLYQIVTRDSLEPKADLCTKVYVWHTNTVQPKMRNEQKFIEKGKRSDDGIEVTFS